MTDVREPAHDYRPINALPYWDTIGAFVNDAVADTAAHSGRDMTSLYPAASAFVLWCWQSRGTPLERPRIFRLATVDEFIHLGMTRYARGSRATHRSTLSLMVEALNPAEIVHTRRAIPRSDPTKPYTPSEIAALYSWAIAQGSRRRQSDAIVLLALGLGAGLATRELLGVLVSDLDVRDDQIQVIVWEGRPRVVPLLPAWQRPLRRLQDNLHTTGWLLRPGRTGVNPGQITDFLQRARTELDVRPSRMRTTWLLEHLLSDTPTHELLRISGLQNLAALDKVATFAPRTGRTEPSTHAR